MVATPTATPLVEKRQSAYANGEVEIGDTVAVAVAASASSIDLGMAELPKFCCGVSYRILSLLFLSFEFFTKIIDISLLLIK